MSVDRFTEVTSESWFSRLGGAFTGILFGLVLFAVSFPLLFWNEGRAVTTYKTLAEAGQSAIAVSPDKVDPARAGKLLHLTGKAVTEATLTDPAFGISTRALRLKRRVEMYQWEEKKHSKTSKKLGGGTETATTYDYSKTWSERFIKSADFKKAAEHQNPANMPYTSSDFTADPVHLGAFTLSKTLTRQIDTVSPLSLEANTAIPEALKGKARLAASGFYIGSDPGTPQIGDVRITFEEVKPTDVSVIAAQIGNGLGTYQTKAGGTVEMLVPGIQSAEAMIKTAQEHNQMLTWLLRLVGFVVMLVGLLLIFKPLSVVADVLPFLGWIVETGVGIMAFALAAALSLVTIAIAWIVYRPLLGIGLLALAAGLVFLARMMRGGASNASAQLQHRSCTAPAGNERSLHSRTRGP